MSNRPRSRRVPLRFAVALAAATAAMPASAQSLPIAARASVSWAKTQAILGGARSALQAILAQQQGLPAVAPTELQPASYSLPQVTRAVVRDDAPVSAGVASGRPDVFGSVALKVGSTRLDGRWRRVEHAPLSGGGARFAASVTELDTVERLAAVNRYVNRRVQFMDDERQYGRADVWAAADETLRRGRGDCEDFAIAKLQMLRRAGIADRNLYLVIVKDLVSRADHAVLVVRAAGHMFVLDNGTDRLLDSEAIRDYRPILTFASTGTWTHGYRVKPAAVELASADALPAPAAETQRSRSASLLAFNTGFSK